MTKWSCFNASLCAGNIASGNKNLSELLDSSNNRDSNYQTDFNSKIMDWFALGKKIFFRINQKFELLEIRIIEI